MATVSVMVVAVLDDEMLRLTALRHSQQHEKALYLAGAGVHHALAELESNTAWRVGISSTVFPSGGSDTYSATVVDGTPGNVIVTGIGNSGGFTRKLTVTVSLGN